ncbi:5761_t:CDS:2 [Funneliformis mosseae]|uniref:5761_t:CDS:1 n=1 Tax=Funneliformis mosseae TaxID=27381 RepID=A0A9N9FNW9_FUNMO|nr:5761_t:CDS:2 [Funneliformis mosseae]
MDSAIRDKGQRHYKQGSYMNLPFTRMKLTNKTIEQATTRKLCGSGVKTHHKH